MITTISVTSRNATSYPHLFLKKRYICNARTVQNLAGHSHIDDFLMRQNSAQLFSSHSKTHALAKQKIVPKGKKIIQNWT